MNTYGWFRFETKEVAQRKDSVWPREHLKEVYHHTEEPGLKYNIMLGGSLRNNVISRIVYYALEKSKTAGQIAHIRYHRVNKNSSR